MMLRSILTVSAGLALTISPANPAEAQGEQHGSHHRWHHHHWSGHYGPCHHFIEDNNGIDKHHKLQQVDTHYGEIYVPCDTVDNGHDRLPNNGIDKHNGRYKGINPPPPPPPPPVHAPSPNDGVDKRSNHASSDHDKNNGHDKDNGVTK